LPEQATARKSENTSAVGDTSHRILYDGLGIFSDGLEKIAKSFLVKAMFAPQPSVSWIVSFA